MKATKFLWAWGDCEAQPDKSMTRERAAKLLRAWRNAKRQGRREFSLSVTRNAFGRWYSVRTTQYINNDAGILVIR